MPLRSLCDLAFRRFRNQSKPVIFWEAFVAMLVIGYFDYVLPYQISLTIFYVMPILVTAWFTDKESSDFIALTSVLVSWWTDELTNPPTQLGWIHTYRMGVRLFFFLFISAGGSSLRAQRNMNRAQIELLERSQQLEREIIRISEREQQRIGQDLHDGLCQYLAAVSCAATSLKNDLQKQALQPETAAAAEIAELLKNGVNQTRDLSRGLFPVQNDEEGLESALSELAHSSTHLLNIQCTFSPVVRVPIYDNAAATHLYRITQEALNNATRHGHATKVNIALTEKEGLVTLRISDNGSGLPVGKDNNGDNAGSHEKRHGMGLKIMDYRARLIGGTLEIMSNPGGGVAVMCAYRQQKNTPGRGV